MEDNHKHYESQEHIEPAAEHHAASPAPTAKLNQQVIFTDEDGAEKAAIVTKVDGDIIGLHVYDAFPGGGIRYIENVPHKEQNPEAGYWQ